MSDCASCPVERECFYPYKPCDCVHQRKFWDEDRRKEWEARRVEDANKAANTTLA